MELAAVVPVAANGGRVQVARALPGYQGRIADLDFQRPNPLHGDQMTSDDSLEMGGCGGGAGGADDAPPRSRSRAMRQKDILQHARDSKAAKQQKKESGIVGERTHSIEM